MKSQVMKFGVATVVLLGTVTLARADVKSKAAAEAAEYLMQRFGRQVAREGTEALARKIETYAARYGEEAFIPAIRKVGPEAFVLVDAAGSDGAKALRVLSRHGEEGATWVLRRPKAMSQFVRLGDDCASVLVKHPGIAEPLVERGGAKAVNALAAVNPQNGRRIAMLMDGEIGKLPEGEKLLDVIAKYGDRGGQFVWENKGALAVGATLTAFVANPEPFINGTEKLAKIGGETVAKPIAEGVAKGTNWTVVILVVLAVGGVILAIKLGALRESRPEQQQPVPQPPPAKPVA